MWDVQNPEYTLALGSKEESCSENPEEHDVAAVIVIEDTVHV
jgi:hypothetical protein